MRGLPVVSGLGILACLALMLGLPGDTWARLGLWLALGFAVYFGDGRRRARRLREAAKG